MKTRQVTKKDVADAAMIAQLIGGADIAGTPFYCVELPRSKKHDCPDCKHVEHVDECKHRGGEWECVASAIGASAQALDLWMDFSNAFFTTAEDREAELRYFRAEEPKRELQAREQLYAWVDSIREGGIDHGDLGLNGLEVAGLLRDGHLPPGWKVVAKQKVIAKRKVVKSRSQTDNSKKPKQRPIDTGELPMVRVVMTARGPQVEL